MCESEIEFVWITEASGQDLHIRVTELVYEHVATCEDEAVQTVAYTLMMMTCLRH